MTEEESVAYQLLDLYTQVQDAYVHSYHPPSGKTYHGALVRIPKMRDGKPTRDRYHLDFIVQYQNVLILQELKGSASQCDGDVLKLAELTSCYSADELIRIIKRRSPVPEMLDSVDVCVGSIAYLSGDVTGSATDILEIRLGKPLTWRLIERKTSKSSSETIVRLMSELSRAQAVSSLPE